MHALRSLPVTLFLAALIGACSQPAEPPPAVTDAAPPEEAPDPNARPRSSRPPAARDRGHLHELIDALPSRELDSAAAFLEFLSERRSPSKARPSKPPAKAPVPAAPTRAAEGD